MMSATTKAILSLSRLVVFVETSQTLPAILSFTAIAYKQNRIVAIKETQTLILCLQVERARSKMLCAVDDIFNLLCAVNSLQPMKNSYFPLRPELLVSSKLSRVALGTRMRLFFTPCQESRSLIGRKGSREHKWWRSNANESRDPKKQYPYCLSRALIGYSRYRPYVLLLLYDR